MPQWFKDVANAAGDGQKSAIRALQAWQFLIAHSHNRQIVRYKQLQELMEYSDGRPLGVALGCIMFYCQQNDLPPLTIIVVNSSGVPGPGFTAESLEDYHQSREQVFDYLCKPDYSGCCLGGTLPRIGAACNRQRRGLRSPALKSGHSMGWLGTTTPSTSSRRRSGSTPSSRWPPASIP